MIVHIASIFYSNNIIDAAISNDIKKVILVHTTGIYSQFKLASEEYKNIEKEIEEKTSMYKIKTIILRPTMIYGNLNDLNVSKFIKYVDRFPIMPVVGDGSSYIQPVNFVDLGRAYYAVMESFDDLKQHEYILSGSTKISLLNFYKLIAKYLNKKRIFVHVPLNIALFGAKVIKLFSLNRVDLYEKILRMTEDRSFSHESATNDFGYNPIRFDEALKNEVILYKENKI